MYCGTIGLYENSDKHIHGLMLRKIAVKEFHKKTMNPPQDVIDALASQPPEQEKYWAVFQFTLQAVNGRHGAGHVSLLGKIEQGNLPFFVHPD